MDKNNQLAVFENENGNGNGNDNDDGSGGEEYRSRPLVAVAVIAVAMLAILIIALALTRLSGEGEAENMVRAGSPEFDAYKDKVVFEIDPDNKMVYPNWIGMWQLQAKAKMTNRGDRELAGVEVIGKMIDHEDKVIAQKIGRPIPRVRTAPLKPGESMDVVVKVDAPQKITEGDVKDIRIELRGLRFQ